MNIYQFMSEHPILTFFMCYMLTVTPWKMWKHFMRHLNIRNQGWPPEHCDADGDFKPEPEDKES